MSDSLLNDVLRVNARVIEYLEQFPPHDSLDGLRSALRGIRASRSAAVWRRKYWMARAKVAEDRIAALEARVKAADELANAAQEQIDYFDLCGEQGDLERNLRDALAAYRKTEVKP